MQTLRRGTTERRDIVRSGGERRGTRRQGQAPGRGCEGQGQGGHRRSDRQRRLEGRGQGRPGPGEGQGGRAPRQGGRQGRQGHLQELTEHRRTRGPAASAGPLVRPRGDQIRSRRVTHVLDGVRRLVRRTLWDKVPRDHRESAAALRRRQRVTVAFVVVGAVLLGLSLRIEPGNVWFYAATLGLAVVWTVGAFASGPLHLGRTLYGEQPGPRPVLVPAAYALVLVLVFALGALVVRQVPWLNDQVQHVLDHADQGSVPLLAVITAINGVAEELFFRGALYAATPRYPVVVTTLAYTATTVATGNPMLVVAALLLGALVGLERRATGGIQAPIITHVVWSVTMLVVLPALFG